MLRALIFGVSWFWQTAITGAFLIVWLPIWPLVRYLPTKRA